MKNKAAFLLFVSTSLTSACSLHGGSFPEYTAFIDVRVYQLKIEPSVDVEEQQVDKIVYHVTNEDLHLLKIEIVKDKFYCGGHVNAWGCYRCGYNHIRVYNPPDRCFVDSALIHELWHWKLEKDTGDCDRRHTNVDVWPTKTGIVSKQKEELRKDICK